MKKIFITLTLFALVFSSCERVDFGDINQDPYAPTEGNIDAMMRGSMAAYAEQYITVSTLYAQYQSQFSYPNEQLYKQYEGGWSTNYVQVLNNLKDIYNTTDDVRGNPVNMRAIAELVSVLAWKRITDTFGDVPYTEALQGGQNFTPNYTSQEAIYRDLVARTIAARDMIDPAAFTPNADTDIYYGGDMDKWGKFANSFILALSLQLSNTSAATDAQTWVTGAFNNSYGFLESVSEDMKFTPDQAGGMYNPISSQRAADYNLSKELTATLFGEPAWGPNYTDDKNPTSTVGNALDFRVVAYSNGNPGEPGLPYGYSNNTGAGVSINDFYAGAGSPFTLFSAAYTWLNRAEAAARGWTTEDANAMLTSGIATSFAAVETMSGYSFPTTGNPSIGQTISERLADVAGSVTLLQVIGEEKWIALFPDGYTAWAEQRRTGFPALHPAPEAVNGGVIPHRMLYPAGEAIANPTGWGQGVNALVPAEDKNTSKIWWE